MERGTYAADRGARGGGSWARRHSDRTSSFQYRPRQEVAPEPASPASVYGGGGSERGRGSSGHGGASAADSALQGTWTEVTKRGRRGAPAGSSNHGVANDDRSEERSSTGIRSEFEDAVQRVADLQIRSISRRIPSHTPSRDSDPPADGALHEASSQQCPPHATALPRRPAPGTAGRSIRVAANHFSVEWNGTSIYQYHVEITPRIWKDEASALKGELISRYQSDFEGKLLVFDSSKFMKIMYTAGPLSFRTKNFSVILPNEGTGGAGAADQAAARPKRSFNVSIRVASVLDQSNLVDFLNGLDVAMPQQLVQSLDVGFRQNPSRHFTAIGRSFYSKDLGRKELGGGLEGCNGYYQSIRPTMQGLALNVDFATIALIESIPLLEFLKKKVRNVVPNRSLSKEERHMVEGALRGLQVHPTHRDPPRKYTISGLTEVSTKEVKFLVEGGEKRVVDHFKETYGYDIKHLGLPCVQVQSSGFVCFPIELCKICEGLKFIGELTDQQRRSFMALACLKPEERERIINRVMGGSEGPGSGEFLHHFGINVKKQMTIVRARILEAPQLRFGERSKVKEMTPERGEWSLRDSRFVEGSQVKHWAVVSFDAGLHLKPLLDFVSNLSRSCNELGMEMAPRTAVRPFLYRSADLEGPKLREVLHEVQQQAEKAIRAENPGHKLQLLVCTVGESHPSSFGRLKRICETELGLRTQCCLTKNVLSCKPQLLTNIALKINAKMGGRNVSLATPLPKLCPSIFNKPTIIFGADVNHPRPKDLSSPSMAAVAANTDWPGASKYAARYRAQKHREEIIQDLKGMVQELWRVFCDGTGSYPEVVLFFRDGVGEGQYKSVMEEEVAVLRDALTEIGGSGYKPMVTWVMVEKRHHTRLFPTDANKDRRSGNILPGTVVDTAITHPREFDFYLCSHPGLQGTSKPTHYHVLLDQNYFSSNDLQRLVYHLCYTYARCSKALSLVPAAQYAHLAAYRARMYFDSTRVASSFLAPLHERGNFPPSPCLPQVHRDIVNSMYYC